LQRGLSPARADVYQLLLRLPAKTSQTSQRPDTRLQPWNCTHAHECRPRANSDSLRRIPSRLATDTMSRSHSDVSSEETRRQMKGNISCQRIAWCSPCGLLLGGFKDRRMRHHSLWWCTLQQWRVVLSTLYRQFRGLSRCFERAKIKDPEVGTNRSLIHGRGRTLIAESVRVVEL